MIELEVTARFARAYDRLSSDNQVRVDKALRLLVTNPRHPSLRVKPIKGTDDIWEASAGMSIRLTIRFLDGKTIQLRNVGGGGGARHLTY